MKTNKQNFSTPITCWNCDTTYDYQQYKDCPICDNHFTAAPDKAGKRVPVIIDYIRGIITTLLCLLFLCGCTSTKPYCPTYAENSLIEEQISNTGHKISNIEKIVGSIVIYTTANLLIYHSQNYDDGKIGQGWKYVAPVVAATMIYGLVKYKSNNAGMRKEYQQLKDSLLNTIPKDVYTKKVEKEKLQIILDSLYTPILKAHGY